MFRPITQCLKFNSEWLIIAGEVFTRTIVLSSIVQFRCFGSIGRAVLYLLTCCETQFNISNIRLGFISVLQDDLPK